MDRKLLVTLLQKNIQELEMITTGFMEMKEYPAVIIKLARQKAEDVLEYIGKLESIKEEEIAVVEKTLKNLSNSELTLSNQPIPAVEKKEAVIDELPIIDETLLNDKEVSSINNEDNEELFEAPSDLNAGREGEATLHEVEENVMQEEALEIAASATEQVIVEEEVKDEYVEIEEVLNSSEQQQIVITETKIALSEEKTVFQTITKSDNTVADNINNKKIDDIRHAISIGDRFRFQRELFDGNGELMNKTLAVINQSVDYDDALAHLLSKFKWNEEDETVESFYQIIKRRFL